ncbi:MAG: type IV toxin-antitoxin system AbiEi family antitoxin domain-containing protein [Actinomycetes bacterium]
MNLRAVVEAIAKEQAGLINSQDLQRLGLSRTRVRTAVRRGMLVRRGRGVYALPEAPLDPDLHAKAMTIGGVISHDSAAAWWGMELSHSPERQHMTLPRHRGRKRDSVPGWRLHRAVLPAGDVACKDGLPVTTPLRTILDCARTLPLAAAVALADSALRKNLVRLGELEAAVASLPRGPGRRRVQHVVDLLDPKAGSVLESLLRILLWENGLLPAQTQFELCDAAGRWVGYFDFAWPELRLVIEADGFEFHSQREHLRRDCRRHNALTKRGWWLLRFTWEDVVLFPDDVIATVRETLDALTIAAV